jgi:D-alanyl-D-alanine carboxypeptidase (penicillin-binding protein 5/6)
MAAKKTNKTKRCAVRHFGRMVLFGAFLVLATMMGILGAVVYPHMFTTRPHAQLHEEGERGYVPTSARPMDIDVGAPQAFVYDVDADEILWQKGEDYVVYPASITKLWSIVTALQYLDADDIITAGDELALVDEDSSLAYVSEGQRLTVEMLVEGMLLPSGNDAAYVLAAAVGRVLAPTASDPRAQVDAFIDEMNRYAAECGLCGTYFTTPDGLAGREHYTTVEDMVLIGRMALSQPLIAKYAATAEDSVVYESGERITWANTNRLLRPDSVYYREGVVGLKTGSLAHNYCVTIAYKTHGKTYIAGVLGAWDGDGRFEDACAIVDAIEAMQ